MLPTYKQFIVIVINVNTANPYRYMLKRITKTHKPSPTNNAPLLFIRCTFPSDHLVHIFKYYVLVVYQIILVSIYSWYKVCILLAIKELSSIVVRKFHNDKIYSFLSHLPNAENYACTFLIWAIKCQYTDIYGYVKIMFAIWAFNETLQKISNDIQQILSTNIWHMNHYNEGLG